MAMRGCAAVKRMLIAVALSAPLASGAWAAAAPAFPTRPVRIIVPFAPGGGNDIIARVVGSKLAESWSQQVVIDNRPGAGGNIAGEIAARAVPDGYTLFQYNIANAIAASLYRKLGYDPAADFAPITLIGSAPFVIVAYAGLPARSLSEFIAMAKAQPGKLAYASGGNGSSTHLAAELFRIATGTDLVHVPYKGGGPALVDVIAGQVAIYFASVPAALPHVRAGRVRPLALTGPRRSKTLPDLPTVMEAGVANYESSAWYGLVVPVKTPAPVVAKLNADVVRLLNLPDVRERLESQGTDLVASSPREFGRHIRSEIARWGEVVKAAKVRVE
jgi:tripartite-type tricarboxylate transporter receptor subunit TctC